MLCSNKHHFCRDDDELIGLLTSRSKAQLGRVDKFYRLKYDMCIAEQIADECSGDYKTFLTAMCKPQAIVDACVWFFLDLTAANNVVLKQASLLQVPYLQGDERSRDR